METGFNQLRRGGRLVMVGAGIEAPTFDPNRMLLNELTVTGSFVYDLDGFDRALELLADPAFPTDELIAPDDVPIDHLLDALQDLAQGRIAAKAMVVPRRSASRRREPRRSRRDPRLLPERQPPVQPRGHERAGRPAGRDQPGRHLPVLGRGDGLHRDAHHDRSTAAA